MLHAKPSLYRTYALCVMVALALLCGVAAAQSASGKRNDYEVRAQQRIATRGFKAAVASFEREAFAGVGSGEPFGLRNTLAMGEGAEDDED